MPIVFSGEDGRPAEDQNAAVLSGLTSGNDDERCLYRGAMAGLEVPLLEWAQAEHERGTSTTIIMMTALALQVQLLASIAGQTMPPSTWPILSAAYAEMVTGKFAAHAGKAAAAAAAAEQN